MTYIIRGWIGLGKFTLGLGKFTSIPSPIYYFGDLFPYSNHVQPHTLKDLEPRFKLDVRTTTLRWSYAINVPRVISHGQLPRALRGQNQVTPRLRDRLLRIHSDRTSIDIDWGRLLVCLWTLVWTLKHIDIPHCSLDSCKRVHNGPSLAPQQSSKQV